MSRTCQSRLTSGRHLRFYFGVGELIRVPTVAAKKGVEVVELTSLHRLRQWPTYTPWIPVRFMGMWWHVSTSDRRRSSAKNPCLYCPKIIGGSTAPTPVGDLGFTTMTEALSLERVRRTVGSDCLVEGYLPFSSNKSSQVPTSTPNMLEISSLFVGSLGCKLWCLVAGCATKVIKTKRGDFDSI